MEYRRGRITQEYRRRYRPARLARVAVGELRSLRRRQRESSGWHAPSWALQAVRRIHWPRPREVRQNGIMIARQQIAVAPVVDMRSNTRQAPHQDPIDPEVQRSWRPGRSREIVIRDDALVAPAGFIPCVAESGRAQEIRVRVGAGG